MYVLTFRIWTKFRICSRACSSFDRGSNWALTAFSNAFHDPHGRTPKSSAALIIALIQVNAPPDMWVATTSHTSSSRILLRRIQCDTYVDHVVVAGCLIPENFPGASKFLSVKGLPKSHPSIVAIGTVPVGLALLLAAVSNVTAGVTVFSQ